MLSVNKIIHNFMKEKCLSYHEASAYFTEIKNDVADAILNNQLNVAANILEDELHIKLKSIYDVCTVYGMIF